MDSRIAAGAPDEVGYHFFPAHTVQHLAGRAVAAAADYLGGRSDQAQLAAEAEALKVEMFVETLRGPDVNALLGASRMLVIAMRRTAKVQEPARRDRWRAVMGALVCLARHESSELARGAS